MVSKIPAEQKLQFRIVWRNIRTGQEGSGKLIDEEAARDHVRLANNKLPMLEHRVVKGSPVEKE